MAFHQPTLPPPKQALAREQRPRPATIVVQRALEDSQEWVLFSPSQAQASPVLSGQPSRLSDFGSLNTIGRTETEEVLEDDELDSLDDGLHAFREPSIPYAHVQRRLDQSGGSILPAHDGLGSFATNSREVQEQFWQHERFNPRRRTSTHHRTSSSAQQNQQQRLEALDEEVAAEPLLLDDLRLERIQKWRFEQSVLAEPPGEQQLKQPDSAKSVAIRVIATQATADAPDSNEPGSLWERITRTVIQNIIGIDETLLSVILGESLIDESCKGLDTVLEMPADEALSSAEIAAASNEWEARLIRRIARELGHLVQSLSLPTRTLPAPLDPLSMDYAGIPVTEPSATTAREPTSVPGIDLAGGDSAFHPTLKPTTAADDLFSDDGRFSERDYWEQTPTLRSVFSYLTRRFFETQQQQQQGHHGHHGPTPRDSSHTHTHNTNLATAPSPASLHRAAVIQAHHPLVMPRSAAAARAADRQRRRGSGLRMGMGVGAGVASQQQHPNVFRGSLKRAGTSCASWSTKRSRRDHSEGGSRHYWDIGGSFGGSESLVLGGVGHWGEV